MRTKWFLSPKSLTSVSCRRWTRATRCLLRIVHAVVLRIEVDDAQLDDCMMKLVSQTSTAASIVNSVLPTTIQFITLSIHLCELWRG